MSLVCIPPLRCLLARIRLCCQSGSRSFNFQVGNRVRMKGASMTFVFAAILGLLTLVFLLVATQILCWRGPYLIPIECKIPNAPVMGWPSGFT